MRAIFSTSNYKDNNDYGDSIFLHHQSPCFEFPRHQAGIVRLVSAPESPGWKKRLAWGKVVMHTASWLAIGLL